ncbi:transglutaminase family protein [Ureibacillus chungkukjangi]|uniref:Transglutaminase-like putative cysteine protease n=1 Tax=Ureibacillus chungkukjangi TaxID=1202712 RepID=A0A318TLE2_9BACL|nr:transglutaminase family protein [Ureibacillus chungkukjangi]PYF04677.1 transglutaminase-like putative cysteine protease [Ureibacillus chungkukjangi]
MKYRIKHTSTFKYDTPVEQSLNTVRLKPRNNECQRLLSYHLKISPNSMTKDYIDIWKNSTSSFYIPEKHEELSIISSSIVSVQRSPYLYQIEYSKEMMEIFHSPLFQDHYRPYLTTTNYTRLEKRQLEEILKTIGEPINPIRFSCDLMTYLYMNLNYDQMATNVNTTAAEAFAIKAGVCQDFTHIMLGVLRHFNIPARYISGYLYVGEDDKLVGNTATHAWVELMLPGIGWIGLDPTNNVEVLDNHIIMCVGRDYQDVSPVEGVYHGGAHTLNVKVTVRKLN